MATARSRYLEQQRRAAAAHAAAVRAASGVPTKGVDRPQPFKPPPIPAGYYDPALDAQRQAATRGLDYGEQDIGLAGRRAQEDYGTQNTQLLHQKQYADQDYTHNVQMLTRQFAQLGRQQGEQARQYGVTSPGLALLSAAKRQENQGIAQGELDTTYLRRGRELADAQTALDTDYNRGVADRGTGLSRARSEDLFYGLDIGAQKNYQAQQAGYVAPTSGRIPAAPINPFLRRRRALIGKGVAR